MKHGNRLRVIVGFLALCAVGCGSARPAIRAAGPFVYVATKADSISQFAAPPSTGGALTPLKPATVPSGPFPYDIAASPQGTSVYVVDSSATGRPARGVSQYTVNPITGRLTPKSPATVVTGGQPNWIAVSPDGTSAYVADGTGAVLARGIRDPGQGRMWGKESGTRSDEFPGWRQSYVRRLW